MNSRESVLETSTPCVKLFETMGVEISLPISSTVYRAEALPYVGPSPIICKPFTRRLVEDQVMNRRREFEISAFSPSSLGFSTEVSQAVAYDHLTSKIQKLIIELTRRRFKSNIATVCVG